LLGEALKLNTPVTKLTPTGDGWRVTTAGGEAEFGAVIYCGTAIPAGRNCKLTGHRAEPRLALRPALQTFSEISYPPVASVVLGFRREDVAHSCRGLEC